ncbi:MAG: winged helix-turn-helix transcriptional regulator [Clostridia bacterium]|nr:winged helix-turn-helix transcriptional regulator [Clostridia bacterium]
METTTTVTVLKAIADDTRLRIVKLLLQHNYCVGALARRLELTEAAISQHLKVLREAGLLVGEKRGYFMHYDVDREQLRALASKLEELASIQREACKPEDEDCLQEMRAKCHVHKSKKECSEEVRFACHGPKTEGKKNTNHGHCKCHES